MYIRKSRGLIQKASVKILQTPKVESTHQENKKSPHEHMPKHDSYFLDGYFEPLEFVISLPKLSELVAAVLYYYECKFSRLQKTAISQKLFVLEG